MADDAAVVPGDAVSVPSANDTTSVEPSAPATIAVSSEAIETSLPAPTPASSIPSSRNRSLNARHASNALLLPSTALSPAAAATASARISRSTTFTFNRRPISDRQSYEAATSGPLPTTGEQGDEAVASAASPAESPAVTDRTLNPTATTTLTSDVAPDKALQLLTAVCSTHATLSTLIEAELHLLAEFMAFVQLNTNDLLTEQGETATFIGIVLVGVFDAHTKDGSTIPLPPGTLIGELSLFEAQQQRTASVTASSDECIIGVITYSDLQALGEMDGGLLFKLLVMFACEGMQKARDAAGHKAVEKYKSEQQQLQQITEEPAKTDGQIATSPTAPTESVSPAAGTGSSRRSGGEILFRRAKNRSTTAPAETVTVAADETLDAAPAAEKTKQQRHQKHADNARFEALQYKVQKLQQQLQLSETKLTELQQQHTKVQRQYADAKEAKTNLQTEKTKLCAQLTQHELQLKQVKKERDSNQSEQQQKSEQTIAALQKQLQTLEQTITEQTVTLQSSVTREQHQQQVSELRTQYDTERSMRQQLESSAKATGEQFDGTQQRCNELNTQLSDTKKRVLTLQKEIITLNEQLHAALPWKNKALDLDTALNAEKKRLKMMKEELRSQIGELHSSNAQYKKLILVITTNQTIKLYRYKRLLVDLYVYVQQMVIQVLEHSMGQKNGTELRVLEENIAQRKRRLAQVYIVPPTTAAHHARRASHANLASMRAAAPSYTHTAPTVAYNKYKLQDVMEKLSADVRTIQTPLNELQQQVKYWNTTAQSFFQRNVELTADLVAVQNTVSTLQSTVSTHTTDDQHAAEQRQSLQRRYDQLHSQYHTVKLKLDKYEQENYTGKQANRCIKQRHEVVHLEQQAFVLRTHVKELQQMEQEKQLQMMMALANPQPSPTQHHQTQRSGMYPQITSPNSMSQSQQHSRSQSQVSKTASDGTTKLPFAPYLPTINATGTASSGFGKTASRATLNSGNGKQYPVKHGVHEEKELEQLEQRAGLR